MTYGTHVLVGLAVALPVADDVARGSATALVLAGAVFGSLLPDADHAGSRINRRTRWENRSLWAYALGTLVRLPLKAASRLPHRGPVTHGPLVAAPIVIGLTAMVVADTQDLTVHLLVFGIAAGYLAHLLADGATLSGLTCWPVARRIHTVPPRARVRTGSRGETVYVIAAALAGFAYWVLVFTP